MAPPTPSPIPEHPDRKRAIRGILEAVLASGSGYGLALIGAGPLYSELLPVVSSQAWLVGLGLVMLLHWLVALSINVRVYAALCTVFALVLTLPSFREQGGGFALSNFTVRLPSGQEFIVPGFVSFLVLWFAFLCPPFMAVCAMVMLRQKRAAQLKGDVPS